MESPLKIEFQGMPATAEVRTVIMNHVAELEQRWERVTACRVVLKAPGQRHRKGGLYEVHIHLSLPDGREVNVGRTPPADERHSDLTFAINDAFKHARRQLQDQAHRTQGQVKHREGPPTGTVVRIDPSGDFGFLETGEGEEVYFHRNSVLDDAFDRLTVGSDVRFVEELGEKGPQASTIREIGKHHLL